MLRTTATSIETKKPLDSLIYFPGTQQRLLMKKIIIKQIETEKKLGKFVQVMRHF